MSRELTPFTLDFGDGNGPLTFYARRTSLGEEMAIEAIAKTHREMVDGEPVEIIDNKMEVIFQRFILRARDSTGTRLFFQPAEIARVKTEFDVGQVVAAVSLMNDLDRAGK